MDIGKKLASIAYGSDCKNKNQTKSRTDFQEAPKKKNKVSSSDSNMDIGSKLTSIAYGNDCTNGIKRKSKREIQEDPTNHDNVSSSDYNMDIGTKLTSIAYGSDCKADKEIREGPVAKDNQNQVSSDNNKKSAHSIKVPRLYKEAARALKKVEEDGDGLKSAIHSLKHPNVKALTALVSEALKHNSKLDTVMTKSKLLKKEVGLAKQTHLVKILLTELLWGKKRLGGESKPVQTVLSYQEKFEKVLRKLESETGEEDTSSKDAPVKKPRYVRVNTLKMEISDAISHLLEEGWNQVDCENFYDLGEYDFTVDNFVDNLLVFAPGTEFHTNTLYLNGSLVLQDKASCLAALALKPRKGREVMDACAAPGMKTSHLAALTNNESKITAIEKSSKRFETLNTILETLGATNVTTLNQNFTDVNPEDHPDVEYILVDPSCSGSGMYTRLEIQLQAKEKDMERLKKLQYYQQKVLRHAMKFPSVKRIVYSTCSYNSEENENVIAGALEWINTSHEFREDAGLSGITWSFKLKTALPNWQNRVMNDRYAWSDMCVRADESDFADGFFVAVLERIKL